MSIKNKVLAVLAMASVSATAMAEGFDTTTITDNITAVGGAFDVIGAAFVGIPIIKWGWKKIASFFGG